MNFIGNIQPTLLRRQQLRARETSLNSTLGKESCNVEDRAILNSEHNCFPIGQDLAQFSFPLNKTEYCQSCENGFINTPASPGTITQLGYN